MNLLKALATTSGMTLLSRILGFVRDAVIANAFGAGGLTDAFFVAFRLPNLLRRLFAEGAFSQAFVPILAEYRNREGLDATRRLVNHTATFLCVVLLATTILGVIFAPQVIWLSAPGFTADPDKFDIAVRLLRVTFPYILFISLVSLAAGILNTFQQFWVPALTPVLLNVSFIVCALALAPWLDTPIMALAWGALLGGIAQLAFQLPYLHRLRMLPRFDWDLSDPGVRRILRLMGPAVVGVSVGQISLLISTIFASYLPPGSVSWLFYADRLMEFPTGLLGAALGTILLPSLVKHHTDGDFERYSDLLDWGLRVTLLLTLPAAVGMAVAAVPLVSTLFLRGHFQVADLWEVRRALLAYSIGLTGLISVKILAPGYYARQDIRSPVRFAILTLALTQVMNAAFIGFYAHAGLALATGLGACINAGLLLRGLLQRQVYRPRPGWWLFLARLCVAVAALASAVYFLQGDDAFWLTPGSIRHVGRLIMVMGGGMVAYFGTLALLGFRLRDFNRRAA
jgi:putative peptidoglycan lipid II flippase